VQPQLARLQPHGTSAHAVRTRASAAPVSPAPVCMAGVTHEHHARRRAHAALGPWHVRRARRARNTAHPRHPPPPPRTPRPRPGRPACAAAVSCRRPRAHAGTRCRPAPAPGPRRATGSAPRARRACCARHVARRRQRSAAGPSPSAAGLAQAVQAWCGAGGAAAAKQRELRAGAAAKQRELTDNTRRVRCATARQLVHRETRRAHELNMCW
jgi:hypothetical protein